MWPGIRNNRRVCSSCSSAVATFGGALLHANRGSCHRWGGFLVVCSSCSSTLRGSRPITRARAMALTGERLLQLLLLLRAVGWRMGATPTWNEVPT